MKTPRPLISSRDYDGIILDMLDDIVSAEQRAKRLIDRVEAIARNPSLRVVNIDQYLWASAAITIVAFISGTLMGYLAYFWLKEG